MAIRTVTPLILTFDEECNVGRTLDSLRWAARVVVLDSGSTDGTEGIARTHSNVSWHVRRFDRHGTQWEYGIRQAGITTDYILALDADMSVPPAFVEELATTFLPGEFAGGLIPFEYRIQGRALVGSIYPTQLRLFRRGAVQVLQNGHTQQFRVDGSLYRFRHPLIHDDRKPVEQWIQSQLRYVALEKQRIENGVEITWKDWLRRAGLMPLVAGTSAYLRAGGPLCGAAAARYALERIVFESLLTMQLWGKLSTRE